MKTYAGLGVKPERFLRTLQRVHGLPIRSFNEVLELPLHLVDSVAAQTIKGARKVALLEGIGSGLGGFVTIAPDVSILALIAMRMLQKLSLTYGFEYSSEEEIAELWLAAATAAGLDLGREFLQKEVVERFVPRIIEKIATKMSCEAVDKLAARVIPLASSMLGGAMNYFFIREWGRRAQAHFRVRHLERRQIGILTPSVFQFPSPGPSMPS